MNPPSCGRRCSAPGQSPHEIEGSGYFAWLFWLFAHVYFLIGLRNRLVVLVDWAWPYWSFQRHARVVAGDASHRPNAPP